MCFLFLYIFFLFQFLLVAVLVEQLIKTKTLNNNYCNDQIQLTSSYQQPVLGSRHSETHTNENNMESSTATTTITSAIPTARGKHNSERAFSHDLSAKEESLIEESLLQLRELIEHLLCSDHSDAPIVIEIDSEEKSLKILPQNLQSSLTKEEEETLKGELAL